MPTVRVEDHTNGLTFEVENAGLFEQYCIDTQYLLHQFSHLTSDIEMIDAAHHATPELALTVLVNMMDNHFNFQLAADRLRDSLTEHVKSLKDKAALERLEMEVDDEAENPRDPVVDRRSKVDYS